MFFFQHRLVTNANNRSLNAKDLLDLGSDLKSESAVPIFEKAWQNETNQYKRYKLLFTSITQKLLVKLNICYTPILVSMFYACI